MITTLQFKTLDDIFNYYNHHLFDDKLPHCIITLAKQNNSYGYFAPRRWAQNNSKVVHEIAINPNHMDRTDEEWHATLVHEMCHLYQEEFGEASRTGYHNKEFSVIMEKSGLITSDTGEEGGKRVGQRMTHYIAKNGAFKIVFDDLITNQSYLLKQFYKPSWKIDEDPSEVKAKTTTKKSKIKYTCSCGNNVWGKTGLVITCNECESDFTEEGE